MKYDLGRVDVRKRGRLPHWDTQHGIYFITFCLFDAIPNEVRQRIRAEGDAQLAHIKAIRGIVTQAERRGIELWVNAQLNITLDEGSGTCFMRRHDIASMVSDAITYFDGLRYELLSWSVMPSHVHVVAQNITSLRDVIHSWKSFTAKEANRLLGRSGEFWSADYWDRCVRDARELANTIEYVLGNPSTAGLTDWPFVGSYPERLTF